MASNLQIAVAAIKVGDKSTARQLLTEIIKTNPGDEKAWLWLATAVDSPRERRHCLQNVLKINPDNKSAQQGLAALTRQASPAKTPTPFPATATEANGESLNVQGEAEPVEEPVRRKKLRRLKTETQPVEPEVTEPPASPEPASPVMSNAAALQKLASDRARGITPNLNGVNLTSADLGGADLSEASLHHVNLQGTNLAGSNLRHSNLTGANLQDANLSGAMLNAVILSQANLRGCNLTGVNLHGADLQSADLSGAQLHGANLGWANLTDTNLTGIRFDDRTRWPDGFAPPAAGAEKATAEAKSEAPTKSELPPKSVVETMVSKPAPLPPQPATEPEPVPLPSEAESHNTQKCPYCAETIKAEAVVCRFCGRDLSVDKEAAPTASPSTATANPTPVKKSGTNPFVILVLLLIGLCVVAWFLASSGPDRPAFEPRAATLNCQDCAEVGMKINLWDSPERSKVVGQLRHLDKVTVIDAAPYEGGTIYRVSANGVRGWVTEDLIVLSK